MKLNPTGLGLAFGIAAVVFYLGCVLLMSMAGDQALVLFINGLLHGLNVESIIAPRIGFWVTVLGLINTFVLSWLFGALIAVVYNGVVSRRAIGR